MENGKTTAPPSTQLKKASHKQKGQSPETKPLPNEIVCEETTTRASISGTGTRAPNTSPNADLEQKYCFYYGGVRRAQKINKSYPHFFLKEPDRGGVLKPSKKKKNPPRVIFSIAQKSQRSHFFFVLTFLGVWLCFLFFVCSPGWAFVVEISDQNPRWTRKPCIFPPVLHATFGSHFCIPP